MINKYYNKTQEILWAILTIFVILVVMVPIFMYTENYPFYLENIVFIFFTINFTRYIFLLQHTALPPYQKLKVAFVFLGMFLIFYLISSINSFQYHLDEIGLQENFNQSKVDDVTIKQMIGFIRSEMLFFGVAAVISCAFFMIRMLVSVWRVHNKKPNV